MPDTNQKRDGMTQAQWAAEPSALAKVSTFKFSCPLLLRHLVNPCHADDGRSHARRVQSAVVAVERISARTDLNRLENNEHKLGQRKILKEFQDGIGDIFMII